MKAKKVMHIYEKADWKPFQMSEYAEQNPKEQLKILGSKVDPPRVKKDQHFLFEVWNFEGPWQESWGQRGTSDYKFVFQFGALVV